MGFELTEIFWRYCKDYENLSLIFEEISQTKAHNVNCVVGALGPMSPIPISLHQSA